MANLQNNNEKNTPLGGIFHEKVLFYCFSRLAGLVVADFRAKKSPHQMPIGTDGEKGILL